ncbi:MAG: UDP-N-acetylmuramoyl-tripeptide--D-alanyl-D-alanine ligase [Candidatus Limnocylindria bacterium]
MPPTIRLDDLLAATGGRLLRPTSVSTFTGASVDSRRVSPGSCYVALRGERVDGHDFVQEALIGGAAAALVERPVELPIDLDRAIIVVDDSVAALGAIAGWWRQQHDVRVVGITGSTGKTIAKEITADMLSRKVRTLRSEGNLNSETGLPITLLRLEPDDEAAVLEMSMYTVGEIAHLARIAGPEVGVVLAVHPTHLERAGSIERIAEAKSELPRGLPSDGLAVLNADDARVAAMSELTPATVRTFGLSAGADVTAAAIESHGLDGTTFDLRTPWGARRVTHAMPGRHLVRHALAAAAVSERFDMTLDDVAASLEAGSHAPHRMNVLASSGGARVVDDTYNASPVSVAGALDFLAETSVQPGRRRIVVLGDMLELGPREELLHREAGAHAARVADAIVTVGERGRWIAEGARASGSARVVEAEDAAEAAELLESALAPRAGDLVLVKASRGIGLERTVEMLTGEGAAT